MSTPDAAMIERLRELLAHAEEQWINYEKRAERAEARAERLQKDYDTAGVAIRNADRKMAGLERERDSLQTKLDELELAISLYDRASE